MRNSDLFERSRQALTDLFDDDQPLGPIQTPPDIDLAEFNAIFDSDNQIWKSSTSQPAIVIGRKGAGKTAFLKGLELKHSSDIVVFLRSNNVFRTSLMLVQQMAWQRRTMFVEDLAEIWRKMFWILIAVEVERATHGHFQQFKNGQIAAYLRQLNIDFEESYDEILRHVLVGVQTNLANNVNLADAFDGSSSFGFSGPQRIRFSSFRDFVERIFERSSGKRALILIDNMEEIDFTIQNLPDAVAALLKAVSEFRRTKFAYGCSFCVPSEMFHKMLDLSSNPSKDFERNVLLQWRAGDILKIATSRLAKYLFLHETDFFMAELDHIDLSSRVGAHRCWAKIFPTMVRNGLGIEESAVTYLMRHTQLLPRNILQIMTEVLKINRDFGEPRYAISERALTEGLRRAEVLLSQETFTGYRQTYSPLAEVCAKTLHRLPVVFRYGELHQAFNETGKAASGFNDFNEFRRMLIETGVIGQVMNRTEKYIIALFEYTLPYKLNVSEQDELCVHPIFSGIYRTRRFEGALPIYPYGSDTEDREYRFNI